MKGQIAQTLQAIRQDIQHVKADVHMLKYMMVEDALLTEEEKEHIEKTIENFRRGKTEDFVPLEKA